MASKDPNAASYLPEDLAALLSKAGLGEVTADMVRSDLAAGAPSRDGRIHLLHYAAWLIQRGQDGRSAQAQAG